MYALMNEENCYPILASFARGRCLSRIVGLSVAMDDAVLYMYPHGS